MFQTIVVYIIISAAVLYVVYSTYKSIKPNSKQSGCAGCSGCSLQEIKRKGCEV